MSTTVITTESVLASIWAEALGLKDVDPKSNFFEIGGDSLKAMEVISRVSESMQVELPLIVFFEDPTVHHLAAVIYDLKAAGGTDKITRAAERRDFPLSYSQQVFWLAEQQNPGTGMYNTPRLFRIRGSVDSALLERTLNELCRRHEILRVRFVAGVNGPVQIVAASEPLHLELSDVSTVEEGSREGAAMRLARETIRTPFDLSTGPIWRARLVQLAAADFLLCIALHHAVSDGFSGRLLMDELAMIYDAFAAGEPDALPAPELHYTDFAAWEQRWMQGARLEAELDYWRSTLRDRPPLIDLPTDLARPADADKRGALRSITIPAASFARVQELAQTTNSTLFIVLAAGLRILLNRWSGQTDILLGTMASNRTHRGTATMIGPFVNPLPWRNSLSNSSSVLDLLGTETRAVMDAFAHQDCPFAKIVEAVNPERSSNDNPLFNVGLMLQNFPATALHARSFEAECVSFDMQVGLIDLRFVAIETAEGLQISCEYKTALFGAQTIDPLLGAYAGVLELMAADPRKCVSEFALPEPLMRQAAEARRREHKQMIAVAASFTAESLEEPLRYLLSELNIKHHIQFAPYQQLFQQFLDPASLLRTADGFAIGLVRFEDWLHGEPLHGSAAKAKLEGITRELTAALQRVRYASVPTIVCFCPPSPAAAWTSELEAAVADAVADAPSIHVIRSAEILDLYPVAEYIDEYAQKLGNVPYTADFFSALGTMLARRMWSVAKDHYKVVALDCDGVMWGGSCRDGGEWIDEAHLNLQKVLKQQAEAGVLLCLCSKNRAGDVWAAFERHPEMPLRRDHMLAIAIDQRDTLDRLIGLTGETSFGLDQFILLTADAAECSAMEADHAEVLALQVPADPAEIAGWLKHVWAFDRRRQAAAAARV